MVKIIWQNKVVELEDAVGLTVREAVLSAKDQFLNISLNFSNFEE